MIPSAPSLAHRGYRLYFAGQSVSLTGWWLQHTALSWLVFSATGSSFALGIVTAAASLPVVLLAPLGGMLADRVNRGAIMAVTQAGAALNALLLGLLVMSGHAQAWHFPVVAAVNGVLTGLEMPSRNAITGDMVPETILPNATGLNSAQYQVARIIGPTLAGVLIPIIGFGWCFIINAASYLAVIPALVSVSAAAYGASRATRATTAADLTAAIASRAPFRTIMAIPGLPLHVVVLFLVGVFGWSWVVVLPAAVTDIYGTGSHGYAVLLIAVAIGALLGSLLVSQAGRLNLDREKTAALCLLLFSGSLATLGLTGSMFVALVAAAPAGLGITAYINLTNIRFQLAAPPAFRGRVMGVYAVVVGAMIPCGSLASSAISERLGPGGAFMIGSAACLACGLLLLATSGGCVRGGRTGGAV